MGQWGRYLESSLADLPVLLNTTIPAAQISKAVLTADWATTSWAGSGGTMALRMSSKRLRMDSAHWACNPHLAMVSTASIGYLPLAVSPESMVQSAPSKTALQTSLTSARVGRGFLVMVSSIWVAQTTGLPTKLQLEIMYFWAMNTFSGGISIPKSPRATMIPSATVRMSSRLSQPSWFSILATIIILSPGPRALVTSLMSEGRRTKEAKTMSISILRAKAKSLASRSEIAGKSTLASGRLTPLLFPIGALFKHLVRT
mmetsp:Transcript_103460/g.178234  ORF Transcript_103460/g.178234 Transcript_103460/m.178234 type:complete len:258 (-) Transcript_103460:923-1696(-)